MKNIYYANLNCGTTATGKNNSNIGKPKKKLIILPAIKINWLSMLILIAGFSFLSNTVFAQQVSPGIVPMYPPPGYLHIEGNLRANTPTANVGDWLPGTGGTGGSVLNADGSVKDATTTYHSIDLFANGDDVFNGGQKKDDNPNNMNWRRAQPSPAKCDINHFLMHVAEDTSTNHTWIAISGDRQKTDGNSFISLQFLQKTLTQQPNNNLSTPGGTFASAGTDGGRTVGDLQVSAEFLNGGGNPNLYLERWELSGGAYKWVAYNFFQTHPNAAYGATNTLALSNAGNYSVFGANNFSYTPNAFLEAAIDITEIINSVGGNDCIGRISTLWVMTKSSQSVSANMTDFVTPIQINLDINVVADAGPDKEYCAGGSTTIGTAAETGITYSWTPATGLSATNVAQPTANPTSTTDYILTVTKTGSNCSSKDTVTVAVNPIPTITGLSIGDICEGTLSASLAYTGITGGANQYKIDWDATANTAGLVDDTGYVSLPASPIIISETDSVAYGTYSGTIYVRNSSTGCQSIGASISLDINQNPVLVITDPAAVCAPNKVDLTAAAVTNGSTLPATTTLSYWTNSNGTGAVADPTMVGAGTYYIKATTNATPACSDIKAVTVTVNPTPVLVLTPPAAVCSPNTVSLLAAAVTAGSTLPAGTVLSYFTNAGATTHVADSANVGAGTYYIKATAPGGCFDIESVTVSVKDKPARPVVTIIEALLCDTVSAPKLEVLCPEEGTYTLTQPGQSNKTFVYDGTNGPVIFTNLKAGKGFSITLDIDGCVSDATTCTNKENECPVDERRANPQPTGTSFTKEMKAYPVPFFDKVTIQFTSDRDEDYVVNLYDVQGRLVKELRSGYSKAGEVMQIEVDGTRLIGNFYVARKISKSGVSIVKLLKSK